MGMVPNYGITFDTNQRRGTIVIIPTLNSYVKESVKTLRQQSLTFHGGNMFNLLPISLREFVGDYYLTNSCPKFRINHMDQGYFLSP